MLKQKESTLNGKIVSLKLITGEEIIAKLIGHEDTSISLSRPLTLVMTMPDAGDDQGHVAFAPWMLGIDPNHVVTLDTRQVVYLAPARTDASEQYHEAVGNAEAA